MEFPVASGRLGLGLGLPDCLPATVSPLPAATYSATVCPKHSTLLQVPLQILCRIGEKALIKCQKGFPAHCSLVSTGFNDCESFARRTFTTPKIRTFTTPKFGHLPPPKKNICQEDSCHLLIFFLLFLAHFLLAWLSKGYDLEMCKMQNI